MYVHKYNKNGLGYVNFYSPDLLITDVVWSVKLQIPNFLAVKFYLFKNFVSNYDKRFCPNINPHSLLLDSILCTCLYTAHYGADY